MKEYKYGELDRVMSKDEFDNPYLGEFKPDERYRALVERLDEYYKQTPIQMGNK